MRTTAAAAFVAATLLGTTPAHADEQGTVTEAEYSNAAGTRHYYIYTPPGDIAGRPLLVWLHGCMRYGATDEEQLAALRPDPADGRLIALAREQKLVMVFPVQLPSANPLGCWNFMNDADQHRDAGEPSIIAGITEAVRAQFSLDPDRTYLAGHSAGALMTTTMGAAYPDLYAAISPWCGGAYRFGTDLTGQAAFHEMGPRARPMPVFLIEDATDPKSSPLIGRLALGQWLGTDQLALDNTPSPPNLISIQHQNADPDSEFTDGRTLEVYQFGPAQVQLLTIEGGGHELIGNATGAARQTIDFLLQYHLSPQ
ncbi:alpha/beta hydrolase family esterase [Nocardia sp. NPDC051052]|uniref:extracellular catalytic domain type 1 short-chain-length polyhydroxyalkanoate depolymerase n=1 Tax=Nocardia sp. NPDC051052 TaxID=3364322 RepID=UPI00379AD4C5